MKIYLVGGAVRDQLLNRPIKERDYVVVEATPQQMMELGYKQVGKNFPVFLHPKTKEEYALARTERKTGKGHQEFDFEFTPNITLEEDLKRRDLTINAIAQANDGTIIDPYNGQLDLKNHILRHVSDAFAEDPLRVLRVARFAARFEDFQVHPTTLKLMQQIVKNHEIETLSAERIWQEFEIALKENSPWKFFTVLQDCGALQILMPEILSNLKKYLKALHNAVLLNAPNTVRFATLLHDLDTKLVKQICSRLKTPRKYHDLAIKTAAQKNNFKNALSLTPEHLLDVLNNLDAFRKKERFQEFLLACESHSNKIPSQEFQRLQKVYAITSTISGKEFLNQGLSGLEIKKALDQKRVKQLRM